MRSLSVFIVIYIQLVASPALAQECTQRDVTGWMLNFQLSYLPGFTIEDRIIPFDQDADEPGRTLAADGAGIDFGIGYASTPAWTVYGMFGFGDQLEKQITDGHIMSWRAELGLRFAPLLINGNLRPYVTWCMGRTIFDYRKQKGVENIITVTPYKNHNAWKLGYRLGIEILLSPGGFGTPLNQDMNIDISVTFTKNRIEKTKTPFRTKQFNVGFTFWFWSFPYQ